MGRTLLMRPRGGRLQVIGPCILEKSRIDGDKEIIRIGKIIGAGGMTDKWVIDLPMDWTYSIYSVRLKRGKLHADDLLCGFYQNDNISEITCNSPPASL